MQFPAHLQRSMIPQTCSCSLSPSCRLWSSRRAPYMDIRRWPLSRSSPPPSRRTNRHHMRRLRARALQTTRRQHTNFFCSPLRASGLGSALRVIDRADPDFDPEPDMKRCWTRNLVASTSSRRLSPSHWTIRSRATPLRSSRCCQRSRALLHTLPAPIRRRFVRTRDGRVPTERDLAIRPYSVSSPA